MQIAFSKKRIESLLLRSIAILAALSITGEIYKFTVGRERFLVNLFDLDLEWNIPSIYSAATLGFASVLLLLIASDARNRLKPFRLHWTVLSALFFALAVDEIIQFHDKLSMPIRVLLQLGGFFHFTWIILFFFPLLLIFSGYLRFLLHLPGTMRLRVISAAIVYLSGAMGVEAAAGIIFTSRGQETLLYAIMGNFEEVLEMTGVYLFISTLLGHLCVNVPYLQLKITQGARPERAPLPGRGAKWPKPTLVYRNRSLPKAGPFSVQRSED